MPTTWSIQTQTSAAGAIGVIALRAGNREELEAGFASLGSAPVRVGKVVVRDLCGVDRGVVARWTQESAHLMPHGGAAVMRRLSAELAQRGLGEASPDSQRDYPEAASVLEGRMLAALSRAQSPLAVDLLLEQPARWSTAGARSDPARDRVLNRLIDPPLVVAVGPPNVGKSSLVNALAGRQVSLVAEGPGTTRDHVGVMIDMSGLAVRYIDTPGVRAGGDEIEQEATSIAAAVAAGADLVVRCGDATAQPVGDHPGLAVALRADLGVPRWRHDTAVSALTGAGLAEFARAVRERLVPSAVLADPGPWRFW